MKKKNYVLFSIVIVFLAMLVSSCGSGPEPNMSPAEVAAQTEAAMTLAAQNSSTATPLPTNTSLPPTATPFAGPAVTRTPLTSVDMTATAANGNIKVCTDNDQDVQYELDGYAGKAEIACVKILTQSPTVHTAQFDIDGELWFITLDRVGGIGNMYAVVYVSLPITFSGIYNCEITGTPVTYLVTPTLNVTPVAKSTTGYLRGVQDTSPVTFACRAGQYTFSGTGWLKPPKK